MPIALRRSTLVAGVRDYCGIEHLTHISDVQLAARMDRAYRRLRARLDQARGHELEKKGAKLGVSSTDLIATAPAAGVIVRLPDDFYQLRSVLAQRATTTVVLGRLVFSGTGDFVEALEFGERERVDLLNFQGQPELRDLRYRVRAVERETTGDQPSDLPVDQLEILPRPLAGGDFLLTIQYLPTLELSTRDISNNPLLDPNGLPDTLYAGVKGIAEEWLILDVAETVLPKAELDNGWVRARKAEIDAQLREQATDRDSAQPPRIKQIWSRTRAGLPGRGRGFPGWYKGGVR